MALPACLVWADLWLRVCMIHSNNTICFPSYIINSLQTYSLTFTITVQIFCVCFHRFITISLDLIFHLHPWASRMSSVTMATAVQISQTDSDGCLKSPWAAPLALHPFLQSLHEDGEDVAFSWCGPKLWLRLHSNSFPKEVKSDVFALHRLDVEPADTPMQLMWCMYLYYPHSSQGWYFHRPTKSPLRALQLLSLNTLCFKDRAWLMTNVRSHAVLKCDFFFFEASTKHFWKATRRTEEHKNEQYSSFSAYNSTYCNAFFTARQSIELIHEWFKDRNI